ncbi:MAG: hypothetical protein WCF30_20690 [Terracidiphilus sp.]
MTAVFLNRISTAPPEYEVHDAPVVVAEQMLADPRQQARPGRLCLGRWM